MFFFHPSLFIGPAAADCAETFFNLCKDDQPTPSKRPTVEVHTSQQTGILRWREGARQILHKLATSSTDTATLVCF